MTTRHHRRRRQSAGFTLVEALVACAVIGIVSAIAIPNLQAALRKSRHRNAYNSVKVLENAVQAYMLDKEGPPDTLNLTTLEPLVSAGMVARGQRASINSAFDQNRLISYYGWTGSWQWGYDYNFTFRPKRDPSSVTCYCWPEGLFRYDTRVGSYEQIW